MVCIQYECQLHITFHVFHHIVNTVDDDLPFFSLIKGLSCGELLCNTTLILKDKFWLSHWTVPPSLFNCILFLLLYFFIFFHLSTISFYSLLASFLFPSLFLYQVSRNPFNSLLRKFICLSI